MIEPVSYETTMAISESWDLVKKSDPRWEEAFGEMLFRK